MTGIEEKLTLAYDPAKPPEESILCIHEHYSRGHEQPIRMFLEGHSLAYIAGYLEGVTYLRLNAVAVHNGLGPDSQDFPRYRPLESESLDYLARYTTTLSKNSPVKRIGFSQDD